MYTSVHDPPDYLRPALVSLCRLQRTPRRTQMETKAGCRRSLCKVQIVIRNRLLKPASIHTCNGINYRYLRPINCCIGGGLASRNPANLTPVLIEKVAVTCRPKDDGLHVCCINTQSSRNKTLAIADHIIEHNIDVMAICETWLKSKGDTNVIKDMLPNGYSIEHTRRPTGKGGGVAIIYRSSLQLRKETTDTLRSLEHVACRLKTPELSVREVVVYSHQRKMA